MEKTNKPAATRKTASRRKHKPKFEVPVEVAQAPPAAWVYREAQAPPAQTPTGILVASAQVADSANRLLVDSASTLVSIPLKAARRFLRS